MCYSQFSVQLSMLLCSCSSLKQLHILHWNADIIIFLLLVFPSNPHQDQGLIVLVAVREAWTWPQALTVEVEERKSGRKKKKRVLWVGICHAGSAAACPGSYKVLVRLGICSRPQPRALFLFKASTLLYDCYFCRLQVVNRNLGC